MVDVVKMDRRGVRGESWADIVRRNEAFGVEPGDNDYTALTKFADYAIEENPGFQSTIPGPADSTYFTLATFKAAASSAKSARLVGASGIPNGDFFFETEDAPYTADDVNIIKADDAALSVGAWVRQSALSIRTKREDIDDATPRSLIRVIEDAPFKLEDVGGGPDKTAAENDAAFVKLFDKFADDGERGTIQLLQGMYEISEPVSPLPHARNLTIQGYGSGVSVLRQMDPNKNGFNFPGGLDLNVVLRELLLYGPGSGASFSGTGKGIYQPIDATYDAFSVMLSRLWIYNFGGNAVELPDTFSSEFSEVHVNYCGGHGIYAAGNTLTARSCYMHNMAAGMAGYKFTSGNATLYNCNGVDTGDIWGEFGESTLDGDASDGYCSATLLNCNVEDFGTIGVSLRNGTLVSIGSVFTAGGTNAQALRLRSNGSGGCLLGAGFILKAGASWKNSQPVHSLSGAAPVSLVMGSDTVYELEFYDVASSTVRTVPIESLEYIGGGAFARNSGAINVRGRFVAYDDAYLAGLGDYADDAAAAGGGIAVSQLYRTGSTVKVRVS